MMGTSSHFRLAVSMLGIVDMASLRFFRQDYVVP